jgi:hypothetical protein
MDNIYLKMLHMDVHENETYIEHVYTNTQI